MSTNPFAEDGAAGRIDRPDETRPLVAGLARGERIGLVGRRGAGRRTVVDVALARAAALETHVLRADLARATSWLEVANALATTLNATSGGMHPGSVPHAGALLLHRAAVRGDRVRLADAPDVRRLARTADGAPLGGAWAIQLVRPRDVASSAWPVFAVDAVLEETARRAVAGRGRYAVVLDGVDALVAEATAADAARLAKTLGDTLAASKDGAPFALIAAGAGPTAEDALGLLAPSVSSVRVVGAVPTADATGWLARGFAEAGTPVDDEALAGIVALSDGLPRFLRDLARACWDARSADAPGEARIDADVVERAADALAHRDAARHAATWAALPASQRLALLAIVGASGPGGAPGPTRPRLASTATSRETGLPITTMQRAVAGLIAKGIVSRDVAAAADDPSEAGPDAAGAALSDATDARRAPTRGILMVADPGFARWVRSGGNSRA